MFSLNYSHKGNRLSILFISLNDMMLLCLLCWCYPMPQYYDRQVLRSCDTEIPQTSSCIYSNLNLTCLSGCGNISGCQAQSLHLSHKCAAWRVGGYFFIKNKSPKKFNKRVQQESSYFFFIKYHALCKSQKTRTQVLELGPQAGTKNCALMIIM